MGGENASDIGLLYLLSVDIHVLVDLEQARQARPMWNTYR